MAAVPNVARPSLGSLNLEPRFQDQPLGNATGFIVEHEGEPFLITNWHVVTGRRPDTGEPLSTTGGVPDSIRVLHNASGRLGHWIEKVEPLYDNDGSPLWLEHPVHGRTVDAVALKLTDASDVAFYSFDPWYSGRSVALQVAGPLSIVGFPFGLTSGGALGVWVQGTVATEPELPYEGLPCFLIDSRTRPGQSGSPVLFYSPGGMVTMADGGSVVRAGGFEQLFGVYSGRINEQSDLGRVWKVDAIRVIVEGATRGKA